jgi:LacI family transcriptional regulator
MNDSLNGSARSDRITIRTVAADAGVSVAAVSKVLRNAYGVSDDLRKRVNRSIETLGYRPSRAARGLRGQTFTIGVLVVDLSNSWLPSVIDGVNAVLAPSDYRSMIGVGHSEAQLETSLIESMIDYKMDGLILIAPGLAPSVIGAFARQIPIVTVSYHDNTATEFDTVNTDDRRGGELAVETLVSRGYRDIAMLTFEHRAGDKVLVRRQREAGYKKAMRAAGLTRKIRMVACARDGSIRARQIREMLASSDRPEALFCWSDLDAIPLLAEARSIGLRVPEDLAIIGFDNSPTARLAPINLASIDQSANELGETATRTLMSRINGRRSPLHLEIEPTLVLRGSLGTIDR